MATGLKSIEVGSFVSKKWVTQMADSDEVVKQLKGYTLLTRVLARSLTHSNDFKQASHRQMYLITSQY